MLLTTSERLMLLSILPAEGSILTLRVVRDLRGELGFTEEEIAQKHMTMQDGKVSWESDGDEPKDVTIGEKAQEVIAERLQAISDSNKLPLNMLPLCEKFIHE